MRCSRFQNLLPGYLYGELAEKEKKSFRDHARRCPVCSGSLREMEETIRTLRTEPSPEFSPAEMSILRKRVRSGISRERVCPRPAAGRRYFHIFSPSLARIAAGILVVITGVLLYSHYLTPPEGVPPEVDKLVKITQTIESEDSEVNDICREIQELEALFTTPKGNGSEAWLARIAHRA